MSTQPNRMPNSAAVSAYSTPVAQKGWFSRNWKWLVPTFLIVFLVLPLALVGTVFGAMKNSDVAKECLLRAQKNAVVVQGLGTPIEEGWMVSGSINITPTSGDADLAVPISGPKGKGTVYVTAQKKAGMWSYSVMEAAIDGSGQRINLLSNVTAGAEPAGTPLGAPAEPVPVTPPVETQPAATAAQPAATPAPSAAVAEPPAAEQAGVIQSQETTAAGIVAELTECRRKEGVLTIKARFRNTSNKNSNLTLIHYPAEGDHQRYYFTAGSKKYFILKDSEGTFLSSNSNGNAVGNSTELRLEPGQTFLWWAKFPAPPADIKKINFFMPVTPPFEDVPITDK